MPLSPPTSDLSLTTDLLHEHAMHRCKPLLRHETGVHLCTLTRLVRNVMYGVPFFVIVS